MDIEKILLHINWLRKIFIYVRLFSNLEYLTLFWQLSKELGNLNCYSEDIGYLFDDLALEEHLEKKEWDKVYLKIHSMDFYLSLIQFKNILNHYDNQWEKNIKKGNDYYSNNTTDVINDPNFINIVQFCKEFLPVFENELFLKLHQSIPPIIFSKLNRVYFAVDEIDYEQLNIDLMKWKKNNI